MARLPILRYPDPRLLKPSRPVTSFDSELKTLVENMAQTMYEAPGVGLAAPQVNAHRQVVVIDVSEKRNELHVFINPQIIKASEEKTLFEEGCLSLPGIYDEIERPARVTVRAQDVDGKAFEMEAEGLLAVCVQHEIDHLKGRVFVDYLSPMKRNRIKKKLLKEEREQKKSVTGANVKKQGNKR
ncbi:peptide deformylase [Oxalobacter paraformigenes]|uniref:Peptide deformylase n=1 Tax=Oxalobacter paraformigenes TaxID=556268 RepID=C3X5C2_9BURK|nr:peptide deformylase [Oxalobacter paraformigenes]EEO28408.1 peptide deformylase [Oxalobacter paraformigenes]